MINSLHFNDATSAYTFEGFYKDADCRQNAIDTTKDNDIISLENTANGNYYFYIKAKNQDGSALGAWNTDATGTSAGTSDKSTDRHGNNHSTKPCLDFPRALEGIPFVITDKWGKRLNNYSSRSNGSSYDNVLDKTGPVLYSVVSSQEPHEEYDSSTGETCQHSYDGHNYIEFRYSEPVDFVSDTGTVLNITENFQVQNYLGVATNTGTSLSIAGLANISGTQLYTGSLGNADTSVNALYRNFLAGNAIDDYAIRLSVAGYTDGTVTDVNGYTYKKWKGYIDQATQPAGQTASFVNPSTNINAIVQDRCAGSVKNPQIQYAADQTEPVLPDGAENLWDLSSPVFAVLRNNNSLVWNSEIFDNGYQAEAIGYNTGMGSTLDRIEFHLFDNTPDFDVSSQPEWFTETGWCTPGATGTKQELYTADSYAADIFGGSRPYASSNRTAGGIRYSTIHSSAPGFTYGVGSNLSDTYINRNFDTTQPAFGGASSLVFTGTSTPQRTATNLEGLYFALPLVDTSLDITTTFTVKYDDTQAFVTDYAGNRLRSKTISTVDRSPPSFDFSVCPVGDDQLEVIFVKALCIDSSGLHFLNNTTGNQENITEEYANLITECFDFITIDDSGNGTVVSDLAIDASVPAKISISTRENGSSFTSMIFKLNRKITFEDIKTVFLRVTYHHKYGDKAVDFFTKQPNAKITFIQDETGNSMQMYTAHALSDFAVGIINPLYAYDSSMTEEDGSIISDGLFHTNTTDAAGMEDLTSWAVHDWNRDQQNYGTLPANRPVAIVAQTEDGNDEVETLMNFRIYLANNPEEASVSQQFNKDMEPDPAWRIWLPELSSGVFTPLAEKNNTSFAAVDGTSLAETKLANKSETRLIFDISKEIADTWNSGDQVSFLFGLTESDGTPVTIMHSPVLDISDSEGKKYLTTSVKMPLFAVRQTQSDNLLSLDLWSFRLKSIVNQRGGVTILNNVIDSTKGEKTVVKVTLEQETNLNVMVMTLDGNIVDYLHRGTASAGEHNYSWDGTNRSGKPVARGMYFIRVTGKGIDETRKVLVVKE